MSKARAFRIIKVPVDNISCTWQAYNVQTIEGALNMIAQGYSESLYRILEFGHINIARGYMRLLVGLVENEEQGDEYK